MISLLLMISCASDETKKRENPFGETTETISIEPDSVIVKEIQYKYRSAILEDDGVASYWFVRVSDSKGTKWTNVVKQNHSYISLREAEKVFMDSENYTDKHVFILDFVQVSEATYIDYTNK